MMQEWPAFMLLMVLIPLADSSESASPFQLNASPEGRTPQEEWNRTFGGSSSDAGTFVQRTRDGGYIITGYTSSYGADAPFSWLIKVQHRGDLWLIKTDSQGNREWDRTYGGLGKDLGFFVQQTEDGGYLIVGGKKSFWIIGNYDLWAIKTDEKGKTLWEKTYGMSGEDLGFSGQQTIDGGYILAGYASFSQGRKARIVKIDSQGNKIQDTVTGRLNSEAACVKLTDDGGCIITGYTQPSDAKKEDVWLIKSDSNGTMQWQKTFGGVNRDLGLSVQQTNDGGYVVTGFTESFGVGEGDVWLIKTDAQGGEEWNRTFGGVNFESGASVIQTKDGRYVITGYKTISAENRTGYSRLFTSPHQGRLWLIKTDEQGKSLWDLSLGGSGNDWGNCVLEAQDGGYVVAGVTESFGAGKEDVWLIKVR